jgi:hypothetical protein
VSALAAKDKAEKRAEKKAAKKSGKKGMKNLPVKRSINLAMSNEKPTNFKIGIPALILIVVAAFAFSKFAVADRFIAVSRAEAEVAAMQSQVNAAYAKLDSFGELNEIYAHYTYSGMTRDEVSRADRGAAIELIRRVILPRGEVSTWTLSGNTLTVNLLCDDLQTVNRAVQDIESDPHVNFCSVNTAATTDSRNYTEGLNARLTIYLNSPEVTRP